MRLFAASPGGPPLLGTHMCASLKLLYLQGDSAYCDPKEPDYRPNEIR